MRKIFAFFSFITVVLSCSAEISADEGDALPGGLRPYRTEFMSLWNNKVSGQFLDPEKSVIT